MKWNEWKKIYYSCMYLLLGHFYSTFWGAVAYTLPSWKARTRDRRWTEEAVRSGTRRLGSGGDSNYTHTWQLNIFRMIYDPWLHRLRLSMPPHNGWHTSPNRYNWITPGCSTAVHQQQFPIGQWLRRELDAGLTTVRSLSRGDRSVHQSTWSTRLPRAP